MKKLLFSLAAATLVLAPVSTPLAVASPGGDDYCQLAAPGTHDACERSRLGPHAPGPPMQGACGLQSCAGPEHTDGRGICAITGACG
jgi:hypothetical protein